MRSAKCARGKLRYGAAPSPPAATSLFVLRSAPAVRQRIRRRPRGWSKVAAFTTSEAQILRACVSCAKTAKMSNAHRDSVNTTTRFPRTCAPAHDDDIIRKNRRASR